MHGILGIGDGTENKYTFHECVIALNEVHKTDKQTFKVTSNGRLIRHYRIKGGCWST